MGKNGSPRYSNQLRKLRPGNRIFACISRKESEHKGFVGYGEVVEEAKKIHDFRVVGGEDDGKLFLECKDKLKAPKPDERKGAGCEWMVRVRWIKEFDREEAVAAPGNPNIVWKLNPKLMQKLEIGFGIRNSDK